MYNYILLSMYQLSFSIDILDYVTGIGSAQFAHAICVALRSLLIQPDYMAPSSVPARDMERVQVTSRRYVINRKDFYPNDSKVICSQHFVGGK